MAQKDTDNRNKSTYDTRRAVRLDPHLSHELDRIAKETGAKPSTVMRAALKRLVDEYNDRDG